MRVCIDMDTLSLVAYHTNGQIRDGLAKLQGTRSHHLFFDDARSKAFISTFTSMEINLLLKNLLGSDFVSEHFDDTMDDDAKRDVIAAYCNALDCPNVNERELDAQLECMDEFLEDDPDTSPRFLYVRGARVPAVVEND